MGATEMRRPLLPRTNDFVFKKIFGEHIEILADLLSCIIEDLSPEELLGLEYSNAELLGDTLDDKASVMDIRAITKSRHPVPIEMQVRKYKYAGKRLQFYSARQYIHQLQKGNDYNLLRKTYTIMFADFVLDDSKHWLRRAKLYDKNTDWEVPDSNEIIVIEMPKVGNDNSRLAKWIRFIKSIYEDELMQLASNNPVLHQAFEVLNELSQKQGAWDEYERREKFFLDQLTNEHDAYDKGVRDAEKRVMREAEQKINKLVRENEERMNKIALKLLGMGLAPEQVAADTGLSIEQVQKLVG